MRALGNPNRLRQTCSKISSAQIHTSTIANAATEGAISVKNKPSLAIRPGGRSSVSGIVATVFGSTGFVGRYVVNDLGRIGSQCIVPYRGDGMNARHLKLMGDLGQIVPVPYDLSDTESVKRAVARSNVVINLIGNEFETRNFSYDDTHVKCTYRIAKIAKEAGVERFIHMSALGASTQAKSKLLQSKATSEEVVRSFFPDATILRPAVVFGHEDRFLNRYAELLNYFPVVPLLNHGEQRLQPVFVHDVAAAVLHCTTRPDVFGKTYELAGPEVYHLREIIDIIAKRIYRPTTTSNLSESVAKMYASVVENLPIRWRLLTRDGITRLHEDEVLSRDALTLKDLGIKATPLLPAANAILAGHVGLRGPDDLERQELMDSRDLVPALEKFKQNANRAH